MKISSRNIFAYFIAKVIILSGRPSKIIAKCLNGEIIISIYSHKPQKKELFRLISWLQKRRIAFVNPEELYDSITNKELSPKGKAILTLDDGWISNRYILSTAEKRQIPVCLFLTAGVIKKGGGFWWSYVKKAHESGLEIGKIDVLKKIPNEERLSVIDNLQKLITIKREALKPSHISSYRNSKWISFGGHSLSHPILTRCSELELRNEIQKSGEMISAWIRKPISFFAYPNGNFSEREIEALKMENYKLGFTTQMRNILLNEEINPFMIPRNEILEGASLAENICRATSTWPFKKS